MHQINERAMLIFQKYAEEGKSYFGEKDLLSEPDETGLGVIGGEGLATIAAIMLFSDTTTNLRLLLSSKRFDSSSSGSWTAYKALVYKLNRLS